MSGKNLHPYLKERLEKEDEFSSAKKIEPKKDRVRISLKEGRFLKETILQEVYPEWEELIGQIDPTYFRIDVSARKADAYADLSNRPLLVVLPSDKLRDEDTFKGYFGMSPSGFIKKVKDGLVIPQILWPEEYSQITDFGEQFLNYWLEDEELYNKRPLVFAGRIQRLFGGELSTTAWVEKYGEKFKEVGNQEVDVPGLDKRRAVEHLCERYGYFTLFWEDGARLLEELLDRYKATKERDLVQFMADFAFVGHLYRTSHLLYTKGSVVTASERDLKIAIGNFRKLVQMFGHRVSPEVTLLWIWIEQVKQKIRRVPTFAIAKIKDLKDREQYYDMRKNDDEVQVTLHEATCCDNKIAQITRNEELLDKWEEIPYLVEEFSELGEKLTFASKGLRFVDRVVEEFAPTVVVQGVEQILHLPPPLREIERTPEGILKEIITKGKESMYLRYARGLKVPLSVWKEGESRIFTLEEIL